MIVIPLTDKHRISTDDLNWRIDVYRGRAKSNSNHWVSKSFYNTLPALLADVSKPLHRLHEASRSWDWSGLRAVEAAFTDAKSQIRSMIERAGIDRQRVAEGGLGFNLFHWRITADRFQFIASKPAGNRWRPEVYHHHLAPLGGALFDRVVGDMAAEGERLAIEAIGAVLSEATAQVSGWTTDDPQGSILNGVQSTQQAHPRVGMPQGSGLPA